MDENSKEKSQIKATDLLKSKNRRLGAAAVVPKRAAREIAVSLTACKSNRKKLTPVLCQQQFV